MVRNFASRLGFHQVPQAKVVKNRLHLDLVGFLDLAAIPVGTAAFRTGNAHRWINLAFSFACDGGISRGATGPLRVQVATAEGSLNMRARLGLCRVSPMAAVQICDKPRCQLRPESGHR